VSPYLLPWLLARSASDPSHMIFLVTFTFCSCYCSYTYGIFKQLIRDGAQVEYPDRWLTFGNPWEIERVDVAYPVRFYGSVRTDGNHADGSEKRVWEGGEVVVAVAYDNPIPGYDTFNTINLRLFRAAPSREFDLASFNTGDYMKAVEQRQRAETISSVLYPSDATHSGKELRLKQQYFFVSATLRDIMRRFKRMNYQQTHPAGSSSAAGGTVSYSSVQLTTEQWRRFPEKNALQLNDTHPTIGIPELMRILVDEEGLEWNFAWAITQETFGYTNHTVLPEALEKWSVDLLGHLLPRHLEIIYKINWHHLEAVKARFGDDSHILQELSLVEEGPCKMIRMANLGIVGSHAVNGVAELHTELLKSDVFPHFYAMYPERFQNKTNGVTPRRWMNQVSCASSPSRKNGGLMSEFSSTFFLFLFCLQCNPGLSSLITKWLDSDAWLKNLDMLGGLRSVAEHPELQRDWMAVKKANKQRLAHYIESACGVKVSADALFDVQVKRIHEYKRQQMNALYCIHRYRWMKSLSPQERAKVLPRVTIFGGKAAPAYEMAKRFIRLIHRIGAIVNNDPEIGDLYKVVFIPNYNVSLAEVICPASDISQHISTAGMEASGTSNMKFAMNGGLIIGTMDGANVEIAQETDAENHFIFGALAEEVNGLRADRRNQKSSGRPAPPHSPELQGVINELSSGKFGPLDDVGPILSTLEYGNDWYLTAHDFPSYVKAQEEVDRVYRNQVEWARRSILTVAGMGKFSTDRTIAEYARDIWRISACRRPKPVTDSMGKVRSFPQLAGIEGGNTGSSTGGAALLSGSGSSRSGTTSPSAGLGMELGGGEPSTLTNQLGGMSFAQPIAVAKSAVPSGQPKHGHQQQQQQAGGRHGR
jgi:glycogen phosphorylase